MNNFDIRFDFQRKERLGLIEAIWGQDKSIDQLKRLSEIVLNKNEVVFITRISSEKARVLLDSYDDACFHEQAKCLIIGENYNRLNTSKKVALISGGSSDLAVTLEAKLALEIYGVNSQSFIDVGVAGLHRLISQLEEIKKYDILIVCAGMEGALATVLGGLLAPMSTTALDPTTTVSSSSSNAGNATGNTSTNTNSDPFADLLGGTSSSSNNNTAPKTTTTTGLSGGTISSFNFMANSTSGNTTTNNMSMQSGSGLDRIKQAQEMARMQQMQQFQKMQRMQQMQMMKRMQQGGGVPQQMTGMNMGMPAMNTGMNTGVYAAGSVKSINLLGEQQNNAAKKKLRIGSIF